MALLYSWATKEYLLWEMTIGQIILYHNKGCEMKYGTGETKSEGPSLLNYNTDELRKLRDESREQIKAEMKAKYGDI